MYSIKIIKLYLCTLMLLVTPNRGFAQEGKDEIGTITKIVGDVDLFQNESENANCPKPVVLFEGKYYTHKKAQIGFKFFANDIIRTLDNSQAHIYYDNGDQFNIGPHTSFKIDKRYGEEKVSTVHLLYGKLRSIVSRHGPRKNSEVKTNNITLGVRGTDFFVNDNFKTGTNVSVLRGEIALRDKKPQNATVTHDKTKEKIKEEIKLSAGFSAKVETAPTPQEIAKPIITKTTKQELVVIQKSSTVLKEAMKDVVIPEEKKAELEKLEKKAIENTIQDIGIYDKKQAEELLAKAPKDISEINTEVVKKEFIKAPEAPGKPSDYELDSLEYDAYKKYFKIN